MNNEKWETRRKGGGGGDPTKGGCGKTRCQETSGPRRSGGGGK